jgi:general secretion pathway protein I
MMPKLKFQSSNITPLFSPLKLRGDEGGVSGRNKSKGFTLIEVLVATAILGIALTVIIQLFAGGLRLARASKEYTSAINYVNTKMEEIASKQDLEEGVTEGEFDETFHWRVTTNKVDILFLPVEKPWEVKPPIQLFKIKVDVLWKSGSKERSAGTETYRTMKVQEDEKKS